MENILYILIAICIYIVILVSIYRIYTKLVSQHRAAMYDSYRYISQLIYIMTTTLSQHQSQIVDQSGAIQILYHPISKMTQNRLNIDTISSDIHDISASCDYLNELLGHKYINLDPSKADLQNLRSNQQTIYTVKAGLLLITFGLIYPFL